MEHFSEVENPRVQGRVLHTSANIIYMTITAAICEVSGWEEIEDFAESRREFFAKRLDLSNGIPSHDTINRFFQIIDKKVYANWMSEMSRKIDSLTISIDLLAILYPSVVNIDASDVVF